MANRVPLGIAIGLGNHKGGVGKSTNAVHIAAALGESGYRCLLIDLDPTAGSTRLLGLEPSAYQGTLELLTQQGTPQELVVETIEEEGRELPPGVHILPARTDLSELDDLLRKEKYLDRFTLLRNGLKAYRKVYDYIIVDTPPQPGSTLLGAAYAALEWFLLSVHAEPLALGGLSETLKDIADVRKHLNRNLEVLGVVIGRVKRSSHYWKEIASFIDDALPRRAFSTEVGDTVQLQRLSEIGTTLFQDKRLAKSKSANEYRTIAADILRRTQNREKFLSRSSYNFKAVSNA